MMFHSTEPCPTSVDKDMHAHAHFDLEQTPNNTVLFSLLFLFCLPFTPHTGQQGLSDLLEESCRVC